MSTRKLARVGRKRSRWIRPEHVPAVYLAIPAPEEYERFLSVKYPGDSLGHYPWPLGERPLDPKGAARQLFGEAVGWRCVLCGLHAADGLAPGGIRRVGLVLDHDHETDLIRGLLCGSCNALVG